LAGMVLTASSNSQQKFDRFATRLRQSMSQSNIALAVLSLYCLLCSLVYYYSGVSVEGPGGSLIARAQLALLDHHVLPKFPPSTDQLVLIGEYTLEMLLYVFAIAGGPLINLLIGLLLISLITSPSESLMGQIRSFLDQPQWAPIATLSYAAYLVHPTIQASYFHYIVMHINNKFSPSLFEFICHALLMVVVSFAVATVLHVFYDTPVTLWLARDNGGKRRIAWIYARICLVVTLLAHALVIPIMLMYAPKGELNRERYLGF
jgi:peptidoglycan/LPS O-acetylase OafA/YrhL